MLFNEPKLLKSEAESVESFFIGVSVLFNEPKLLKCSRMRVAPGSRKGFSALQRAEIAEIKLATALLFANGCVSVLFNEPKLLKSTPKGKRLLTQRVSVLFNEPKLLKSVSSRMRVAPGSVSVLFNEPKLLKFSTAHAQPGSRKGFSALQRAEIAEIVRLSAVGFAGDAVSVLFNEPKLLKSCQHG